MKEKNNKNGKNGGGNGSRPYKQTNKEKNGGKFVVQQLPKSIAVGKSSTEPRQQLPRWMRGTAKVFSGKTSLEWIVFRKKMVNALKTEGVYYLVETPVVVVALGLGAVAPGMPPHGLGHGAHVVGAIMETLWIRATPDGNPPDRPDADQDAVDTIITAKVDESDQAYADAIAWSNQQVGAVGNDWYTNEHAQRRAMNLEIEARVKVGGFRSMEFEIREKLVKMQVAWDEDFQSLKDHQGKVLKVFTTMLDAKNLAIIQANLDNDAYRAAWVQINQHFLSGLAGAANIGALTDLLVELEWIFQEHSIMEFIDCVVTISDMLNDAGNPITDQLRVTYVLKGVKKAIEKAPQRLKAYALDVEHIERSRMNMAQMMETFQSTENKEFNELNRISARRKRGASDNEEAEWLGMAEEHGMVANAKRVKNSGAAAVDINKIYTDAFAAAAVAFGGAGQSRREKPRFNSDKMCNVCNNTGHTADSCWYVTGTCKKCNGEHHWKKCDEIARLCKPADAEQKLRDMFARKLKSQA